MNAALLIELKAWREAGWLRRLDAAFAGFMAELDPQAAPELLLASALLSHLEGQGHSCLDLAVLLSDPDTLLGWNLEGQQRLQAQLQNLAPNVAAWRAVLCASPLVALDAHARIDTRDQANANANSPLVMRGTRLYLRRYCAYERRVAGQVMLRCRADLAGDVGQGAQDVQGAGLNESALAARLATLFPARGEFDWQAFACAVALRSRFTVITGGPGTGKTYTAARLLALMFALDEQPRRLRVGLAAPTGKAAARLKQSIETALVQIPADFDCGLPRADLLGALGAARTLHALLGARPDTRKMRADAANPLSLDVLIVDEASMIHLEMMANLLDALPPQARVIFLGDKDQLASVEAGAVLGDLCSDAQAGRYDAATARFALAATGVALPVQTLDAQGSALAQQTVMLRESRRFGGPIGALALAVNRGDAAAAMALLRTEESQVLRWTEASSAHAVLPLALHGREGAPGGYSRYLAHLSRRPIEGDRAAFEQWAGEVIQAFETFRLLCAVREGDWGVAGLNQAVERALQVQGLLSKSGEWYEGRPIMVTRNDSGLGVFNGDIGIVLRSWAAGPQAGSLRAYFADGAALRSVAVSRLADVETAFAMTVHKSQGSEFEHTVLVLPDQASNTLSRELVYTGITRARKAFTLVSGRSQSFAQALGRRTRRASGLLDLLNGGGQ
ncbi:exodeoxyribonuclease V subunit alpha [Roseateles koreensis]|uniref:RecBCD enzyme subunit RecD n=1 Tax=Roseateles koreensis TaxID=2987526 RepID=A0ABT5KSX5_9BURK|nr:exodeoxyribonuclease V subunit alpha [Roseateles koreensis]MDC8785540.1 exodeoxyribonuclease V subunit alpha [Roseateles koreensis]